MLISYKIQQDIVEAELFVKKARGGTKKDLKTAEQTLFDLKLVAAYLKTNPTEEFVKKERDRVDNRLHQIDVLYIKWIPSEQFDSEKRKRKAYDKMHDVHKLLEQLKTLDYILNNDS